MQHFQSMHAQYPRNSTTQEPKRREGAYKHPHPVPPRDSACKSMCGVKVHVQLIVHVCRSRAFIPKVDYREKNNACAFVCVQARKCVQSCVEVSTRASVCVDKHVDKQQMGRK